MVKYIIKRLFQSVVVVLLVVCVVFTLLRLMPSDYFFTEDELMKFTESQTAKAAKEPDWKTERRVTLAVKMNCLSRVRVM